MPRSSYGGNKRRKEIEKKKKREAKLARKHNRDSGPSSGYQEAEDTSYLEYLHPGGVPEELVPDADEESDEEQDSDEDE